VHSGDVKIYQLVNALPRAFVVPEASVLTDPVTVRARLADPSFSLTQTVIVDSPLPAHPSLFTFHSSPVTFTTYTSEYLRLTATGPGYLLLTDAHYPGWVATVDGTPTPIARANLIFRAIALPEGTHTVEFRFAPLSVSVGLWISGLAWLGVVGWWVKTKLHRLEWPMKFGKP
jgi:hypothetical protein